jgi:excinuclease ABC subunit B
MYADTISEAMEKSIKETERRRTIQNEFNIEHNITPTTIKKEIQDLIKNTDEEKNKKISKSYSKKEKQKMIDKIENEMMEAAKELDFERATELRDLLFELKME